MASNASGAVVSPAPIAPSWLRSYESVKVPPVARTVTATMSLSGAVVPPSARVDIEAEPGAVGLTVPSACSTAFVRRAGFTMSWLTFLLVRSPWKRST